MAWIGAQQQAPACTREDLRETARHAAAHACVSHILNPGSVKAVVVRSDGTGYVDVHPSVRVSTSGKRMIAAAPDIVTERGVSNGDLEHHRGDVAAWREAKDRARVLLANHQQAFDGLVRLLLELGEVDGRQVALVFELEEKEAKRQRAGGELRWRESPVQRAVRVEPELRHRGVVWRVAK
jgi:hypothetical protein